MFHHRSRLLMGHDAGLMKTLTYCVFFVCSKSLNPLRCAQRVLNPLPRPHLCACDSFCNASGVHANWQIPTRRERQHHEQIRKTCRAPPAGPAARQATKRYNNPVRKGTSHRHSRTAIHRTAILHRHSLHRPGNIVTLLATPAFAMLKTFGSAGPVLGLFLVSYYAKPVRVHV